MQATVGATSPENTDATKLATEVGASENRPEVEDVRLTP
jgi:hypothetical protein